MGKHLLTRIGHLFSLIIGLLLVACRITNKNIHRGAWRRDKEGGVWYQEMQLTAEPKDGGDASRIKANYRETLWEIPGLNGMRITRYPFPDGNWVIKVTFSSHTELDDAMKRDKIPPLIDGVPVVIRYTPATYDL